MEKEAAVSLPLRNGKEDPSWCQSQGLSSSRRPQLMHLCDQAVISAPDVDDQVQLKGLSHPKDSAPTNGSRESLLHAQVQGQQL